MSERRLAIRTWLPRARAMTSKVNLAPSGIAASMQRLRRSARGTFAARMVWILALGFVSLPSPLIAIPWRGDWPDTSWMIGLILAARQHLQWGTQIIWTYGPLGYIENPIFITMKQWAIAVVVGVGLQMALVVTMAVLLSLWRSPLWTWLVVAGVLVIPGAVVQAPDLTGLLLGVCLLVLALEQADIRRRSCTWATAAGLVLALIALIKGTSLVCGVAMIALFILACAVRRKAAPAVNACLGFAGGFTVLWLLAGQSPQNIPAYVYGMLELSGGYSAAMGVGPTSLHTDLAVILVLATGVGVFAFWKLRVRSAFYLLLLLFPVVGLGFKQGFVRADIFHEPQFFGVAALGAALLLALAVAPSMTRGRVTATVAAVVAVGLSASYLVQIGTPAPLLTVGATVSQYQQAWTLLTQPATRVALMNATSAGVRGAYDLPPGMIRALSTGTVDPIPVDIAIAYAYGLAWDPSPVLQSYSAYTPYLDDADAAHLAAATAPAHVVYSDVGFDQRYPLFDEPAAFRALLQHYRPTGSGTSAFLVLSKVPAGDFGGPQGAILRDSPASGDGAACGPLGAALPVPELPGRYTFASVSVSYSLVGTALNALYRPGELLIRFGVEGTKEGWTPSYTLDPSTAGDGLFVSGYIADQSDLVDALGGDCPPDQLTNHYLPRPGRLPREGMRHLLHDPSQSARLASLGDGACVLRGVAQKGNGERAGDG